MNNHSVWTKDFSLLIISTIMGAIGNIIGGLALSFLVFEETESTLASALTIAVKIIPYIIIPLFVAPFVDRLPRKPLLVGCDLVSGIVNLVAGFWLLKAEFNYFWFLFYSLVINTLGGFDTLTFNVIFPKVIPEGLEEKGYSISSLLYPIMVVIVTPITPFIYEEMGVGIIIIIHGISSIAAAYFESHVKVKEEIKAGTKLSIIQWKNDIKEMIDYLKHEKGLLTMNAYSSVSNGISQAYSPLIIAFFSSMNGYNMKMYSWFSVFACFGRTIGGIVLSHFPIKKRKKYGHALIVYLTYDVLDAILLHLSYPVMLLNRTICGYLGVQSYTLRYAAIQKYIPDDKRARWNAFSQMSEQLLSALASIIIGFFGDIYDVRWVMTVCGIICVIWCFLTQVKNKNDVQSIYLK